LRRSTTAAGTQPNRAALVAVALRLSWMSVGWAILSGAASVTVGLLDHSLAIVGVGLNLAGDLVGSLALVWRFRHEREQAHRADEAERVARLLVGACLSIVAVFLTVEAVRRLSAGATAADAVAPILVAAASLLVLPPLSRAKRRAGSMLGSRALRGDGTLSGVGAAIALLAVLGLVANRTLGWWWADSAAALAVAAVAAAEARAVLVQD
jgi:divalent metal cation (Fe/Co/Zn/Cd) transporter